VQPTPLTMLRLELVAPLQALLSISAECREASLQRLTADASSAAATAAASAVASAVVTSGLPQHRRQPTSTRAAGGKGNSRQQQVHRPPAPPPSTSAKPSGERLLALVDADVQKYCPPTLASVSRDLSKAAKSAAVDAHVQQTRFSVLDNNGADASSGAATTKQRANLHYWLGTALANVGDSAEAALEFEAAVAGDPLTSIYRKALAEQLFALSCVSAAKELQAALNLSTTDTEEAGELSLQLAACLWRLNLPKGAGFALLNARFSDAPSGAAPLGDGAVRPVVETMSQYQREAERLLAILHDDKWHRDAQYRALENCAAARKVVAGASYCKPNGGSGDSASQQPMHARRFSVSDPVRVREFAAEKSDHGEVLFEVTSVGGGPAEKCDDDSVISATPTKVGGQQHLTPFERTHELVECFCGEFGDVYHVRRSVKGGQDSGGEKVMVHFTVGVDEATDAGSAVDDRDDDDVVLASKVRWLFRTTHGKTFEVKKVNLQLYRI
jgi:hypothetical protein